VTPRPQTGPANDRITVVIADDYPAFREALQQVIDAEPDMSVVAAEQDGLSALVAIRRLAPAIAVLDVRMPGLDGIEVARRLAGEGSRSRAVIVSWYRDPAVLKRAQAAGVRGYVAKDTALSEVVAVVRAVAGES
jgi:DNA-binding NarL/FixJ family response regulator